LAVGIIIEVVSIIALGPTEYWNRVIGMDVIYVVCGAIAVIGVLAMTIWLLATRKRREKTD